MNNGINLLRGKVRGQLEREKKIIRTLRVVSIVLLFSVVSSAAVLFVFTAKSNLYSLQKEQTGLLSQLSRFNAKAAKLLLTENRVKDISKIIDNRSNFDKTISLVTEVLPANIIVDSFTLDKKNITMSFRSSSLSSINTLLEKFTDMTKERTFIAKLTMNQLSIDPTLGVYIGSVSLDLL